MIKRIFVVFFLMGIIGTVSGCDHLLSSNGGFGNGVDGGNGAGSEPGNGFGNGTG